MKYSDAFESVVNLYRQAKIEFPALKAVTVAQWMLETGRGFSKLAVENNNFGGMKWRAAMAPFADKRMISVSDGRHYYCSFRSQQDFIAGYWVWLERAPYAGWRDCADDAEAFISFIGPIWAEDPRYVEKVMDLLPEAEDLLGISGPVGANEPDDCCSGMGEADDLGKPTIDREESTTHHSSRNGTDIDKIILHYTTSRNIEGTIQWFKSAPAGRRTSAHYIINLDGTLVQMVSDDHAAWHAGNTNKRSIGIEHVAAPGDAITDDQSAKSIWLIRWLMKEYDIERSQVLAHKCVRNTNCCGDLFQAYGGASTNDCAEETKAVQAWLAANGVG